MFPPQIPSAPREDLGIVVVIPCYDEPDLKCSLEALLQADSPSGSVEVIIVINGSVEDDDQIKKRNEATFLQTTTWAAEKSTPRLQFYVLYHPDLPAKKAGVGLARKIGMDEAAYRFSTLNRSAGIILCFDADSHCDRNYFRAIETHFRENPQTQAASVYFEHPLEGDDYSEKVYHSITQYELHLRYYINAKRFSGFPFAYQTIGSAMAVRRDAYQRQGGMNKRKAGEDFYFLNKFMHPGWFAEINTTRVIPSPRTSHRVPFGTGKAVSEMLVSEQALKTYHPLIFQDLKVFLTKLPAMYQMDKEELLAFRLHLPKSAQSFLHKQDYVTKLTEIQSNTSSLQSFKNRFYQWFNPFLLMKFVHHARDQYYPKVLVEQAARWLLKSYFRQENVDDLNLKDLLLRFRIEDRK